jgi:LacI family transcriptional regulator
MSDGVKSPARRCKSIYDLAEKTGVSVGTVSRVLNNRQGVAADTRKIVLEAARLAKFKPRMAGRQTTVAVVSDRVQYVTFGGYLSWLITYVVDALVTHDIAVELYTEHNINTLGQRLVDGVLAMTCDYSTEMKIRSLQDVPVVFLNRADLPEYSSVVSNHYQSGVLATEHLLDRGHERIAFLAEADDWGGMERIRGYKDSLAKRGIPPADSLIAISEHRPLYGVLQKLMEQKPTAIFLAGEDIALESTYILTNTLGLRIPDDVSIIGVECPKVSQFLTPPHTTVYQPIPQLATQAMEVLTKVIHGDETTPRTVVLDCSLIVRDSVKQR